MHNPFSDDNEHKWKVIGIVLVFLTLAIAHVSVRYFESQKEIAAIKYNCQCALENDTETEK